MEFPRIVLKVNSKNFSKLVELGNRLIVSITGHGVYLTPSPSLETLQDQITLVEGCIADWGPKGARGSKDSYVTLVNEASLLHLMIKEMSQYCSNTAEQEAGTNYSEMAAILASSGFELAKTREARGVLEAVKNFQIFKSRSLNRNQVKFKWSRPVNTSSSQDVNNYQVLMSLTPEFSAAAFYANTTKGEFIDTNDTLATVTRYYWVIPYNPAGPGAVSVMLSATMLPA